MHQLLKNILFGLTDAHVILEPVSGQLMHPEALTAFSQLRRDAREAGFDPKVVSGFRDFERQRTIWNAKAGGQRPVFDSAGRTLDVARMSPEEIVFAILRWSALPGGSRHHWGTDFDVIDAAAVAQDYRVQLTPEEVADDGVFGPFHCWLDEKIATGRSYGLFRPYAEDRGGVAPERWHLSYAPRAKEFQQALCPDLLREQLQLCQAGGELALADTVCSEMGVIYPRFVEVPEAAYPANLGDRL
ncbi:M15 family metallopeptidase [Microbulbifer hydrolyticus]|uniref:D-alanyl-D-alanine carboxypeptidase family protein n=1 Tax=Microbulbifer hydrolyticus TaxID=48074 RepID=A0A6P1TDK6_9GAMM|nr:M15 family metallopeptidase [Microbulbifer hydrolyticus]MBB5212235.1 LAS superfamily LD-carboxypeptidase LdcB [Microbulbifer hydrolyticus]QHQ39891.1 D-alanyl-D-alanine carboxypeptidase family protein [Microbulbifer hydrolyticus]